MGELKVFAQDGGLVLIDDQYVDVCQRGARERPSGREIENNFRFPLLGVVDGRFDLAGGCLHLQDHAGIWRKGLRS